MALLVLPGDFESSEEPDGSEDGEADGRHDVALGQHQLNDGGRHHEAVELVEQRRAVALK